LLTLSEVLDLQLNADWVVLSACNTAAADGAGAEAVSGLGRAFFYAGTKAVLATHWAVESESAMRLTSRLFRHQAAGEMPQAKALAAAMLKVLDEEAVTSGGKPVLAYAHPLFWAPYSLFGDGG
jgi:CHAT domain-containing protein